MIGSNAPNPSQRMNSAARSGRSGPHLANQAAAFDRRGERPDEVVMGSPAS
jgi:hypothetical protein